ncbi:hypothetical protein [Bradyrhizobium manausense]|uniref:hypothetical protein n=1 Tax=Bradyrhizobium manausense TaxID=989370 RepID=UPI001BA91226|nr:hypothetical protein [Bradyrhizobium manausense]MBR0721778.1 hypothetical protein [Bradyrhizobium manausense]
MKKQPENLSWYVGQFKTPRGPVYRPLRVRVIGTLERLFNGLSKTVIEQYASYNKHKKVKPSDFVEVGGPFASRRRAMRYVAQLAGGDQRKKR